MKRIFSFSLIILFILPLNLAAQTVKLKIIQSTDEHGAIFPYDFTDQRDINNSLAQVYSYIKQERAKPEQEVLLTCLRTALPYSRTSIWRQAASGHC